MYYMNATLEKQRRKDTCSNVGVRSAVQNLPADSDVPLPPNAALEDAAHGHHHHAMTGDNNDDDNNVEIPTTPESEIQTVSKPVGVKRPNSQGNTFLRSDGSRKTSMLKNPQKSQNRLSTSFSSSNNKGVFSPNFLDNVDRNRYADYGLGGRSAYLLDYPNYDDYYDVMRQRNRNRMKKPLYDLYDSPNNLGFSEFPQTSYPALSRNRNKEFNEKYDEYAAIDMNGQGKGNVHSVVGKKGGAGPGLGAISGTNLGADAGSKMVEGTKNQTQSSSVPTGGDKGQVEGILADVVKCCC